MTDLEADPPGGDPVASDPSPVVDTPAVDTPPVDTPVDYTADPTGDPYDFDAPEYSEPAVPDTQGTPATPAAPAGTVPAPVADVPGAISQAQIQRAQSLGIPSETIAAFQNPAAAELAMAIKQQGIVDGMNFARQQAQQQQVPQQVQQQQQLPPLVEPGPAPGEFNESALRSQMQQQGYEQSLQDLFVSQAKTQHEQAVAQHVVATKLYQNDVFNRQAHAYMLQQDQRLAQIQQENQQRNIAHQQELINRDFDSFKDTLPEPIQKLVDDPASKQSIINFADAMLYGMHQRGQQLPANGEAFKMAAYAILGDKMQQRAVDVVRGQVKTHQNRAVSKPSSAGGTQQAATGDPVSRAAAFWEAGLAKAGVRNNSSSTLPDF